MEDIHKAVVGKNTNTVIGVKKILFDTLDRQKNVKLQDKVILGQDALI